MLSQKVAKVSPEGLILMIRVSIVTTLSQPKTFLMVTVVSPQLVKKVLPPHTSESHTVVSVRPVEE